MAGVVAERGLPRRRPQAARALNLSNRVLGSNPRKQKLTEAAGTNPSKMGG